MGKSTNWMAIFNSYVSLPEGTGLGFDPSQNNVLADACSLECKVWSIIIHSHHMSVSM